MLHIIQGVCKDEKMLTDLGAAATEVTKALNDLLNHIKQGSGPGQEVCTVVLKQTCQVCKLL
jgi:hypothetical protein